MEEKWKKQRWKLETEKSEERKKKEDQKKSKGGGNVMGWAYHLILRDVAPPLLLYALVVASVF